MEGLSQTEMRELEQRMQKRQVKEFMNVFGNLVDHCFMSCVDDFTTKSLNTRETGCVTRCVQKQMSLTQRLSERFQEQNQAMGAQQR
ncbi:TIM23-like protein [Microdochium nivale]|nr:TIM23-like protein [Microdochium nivale]